MIQQTSPSIQEARKTARQVVRVQVPVSDRLRECITAWCALDSEDQALFERIQAAVTFNSFVTFDLPNHLRIETILAGKVLNLVPDNPRCRANEAENTYQLLHAEICDLCARALTLADLRKRLPAELAFDFDLLADDPECLTMWNTIGYLFDEHEQPVEVNLFYIVNQSPHFPVTATLDSRELSDGRTATAHLVLKFDLESFRS